ncbi:MAG: Asp23/Gls24 family envelope stress response protein [Firmicutes bacterium]|nr:Asp23/Gls24 family envelope stress response protein [Bacillota bacterium]
MLERVETDYGIIDIERPAAAKIIKETILKQDEVYGITNANGIRSTVSSRFAFDRDKDYIRITKDKEDGIFIEVDLILYFGVSISGVTDRLIREIRMDLAGQADIDPAQVTLHIIGLKPSGKGRKIIERDIVVKG